MLAIVENQPVCKIYPSGWQIVCSLINSPVPVPDKNLTSQRWQILGNTYLTKHFLLNGVMFSQVEGSQHFTHNWSWENCIEI